MRPKLVATARARKNHKWGAGGGGVGESDRLPNHTLQSAYHTSRGISIMPHMLDWKPYSLTTGKRAYENFLGFQAGCNLGHLLAALLAWTHAESSRSSVRRQPFAVG